MRVMMISDHADPLAPVGGPHAGGQNIFVRELSAGLAAAGASVDVFTRWDDAGKPPIEASDLGFRVVRVQAGPVGYLPRDDLIDAIPEFVSQLSIVASEYDVIHSNYWYSGLVGLELSERFGIPQVHVNCSIGAQRAAAMGHESVASARGDRMASERRVAQGVVLNLATSPVEAQWIRRIGGIGMDRIRIVPAGVDASTFRPSVAPGIFSCGWVDDPDAVLYVGRLEERKGLSTLVRSMVEVVARRPHAHLAIAGGIQDAPLGSDAELETLRQNIASAGLSDHCTLLGPVARERLPDLYSAAVATIVPSYYEPFGMVAVESLACATPVIASSVGGLSYIVADGCGELVPPRDESALAGAILKVLAAGKATYRDACRDRVLQEFDWNYLISRYLGAYREAQTLKGIW